MQNKLKKKLAAIISSLYFKDDKHSEKESRWYCLGKTNQARKLFVVFTVRNLKIRVISARDMHKKEREIYEKKK